MNRLTLKSGRWPAPGVKGEVVVNQRFLEARSLELGQHMNVLLNGKLERLALVGTVLTPEYIYATRGGGMPDDEWFAVLWIDARALAAAFNMEGAFNSVLLRLQRGTTPEAAVEALDQLLEPYGGFGAVGRADQVSDKILSQEINQQSDLRHGAAGDLPAGGGLHPQRGAAPAGERAARRDRGAEGAGLRRLRHRLALPQVRLRHRAARRGDRRVARQLARQRDDRAVHRFLPLPRVSLPARALADPHRGGRRPACRLRRGAGRDPRRGAAARRRGAASARPRGVPCR